MGGKKFINIATERRQRQEERQALEAVIKEMGYCRTCRPIGDEGPHFRHDGAPCAYHPGECSDVPHVHQFCPCGVAGGS